MKRLPFRRRLTLWSTLVVIVALLICGGCAALFVHQRALADLDAELRAESDHFFTELRDHGGAKFDWKRIAVELREWLQPTQPPRFTEIRTASGEVRHRSQNLPAPGFGSQAPGLRSARVGATEVRLFVAEVEGVTFAIAADLHETKTVALDLLFALLAGMPFALAFAWLGGRWLAGRALAPVEEIAAAAEDVTAERLDRRVPVPEVADEIQRLATVLNATFDRLERSYEQALRFSADASHELKTPLTILRASIESVLESPTLAHSDHEAITGLLDQTRRLSNITSSLLLLARADAGRLVLDAAEHDLAPLTEACAEDARIVAEASGVQVDCQHPPTAPACVDTLRFAQILSNLLDNAVKYNHSGGAVRVTLSDAGDVWRLAVANTGPGIATEHQARLFERFFRAEHSAETSGQGLGLGLARELARAHGGEITLTRSDAEWTEFALTLPKAARGEPIETPRSFSQPIPTVAQAQP